MKRGVSGVFAKPTLPEDWESLGKAMREVLRQAGRGARSTDDDPASPPVLPSDRSIRWVAVGASTGGPSALCELLQELGPDYSARVVVVQHIAAGFEGALADWLNHETGMDVRVAGDGELPPSGSVRLAPGGTQLRLDRKGRLQLDSASPHDDGHLPAVDVLFRSLLGLEPRSVAAVLLSGMGSDGAAGMLELRRAGAMTVVQEERSCAVWGMPRTALEARAAEYVLEPAEIGRLLAMTAGT
jgi:two-component system chemotaxis response regulator CheB